MTGKGDATDDDVRQALCESHALIYADGCGALTMYECCYAMWYVGPSSAGELAGGSLWHLGQWKLSEDSLKKVRGG